MNCRKCGINIEEEGLCNISPFCGYPVCEDCKDEIMCDWCCDTGTLYYDEDTERILCKDCLVRQAETKGILNSSKVYYDEDWQRLGGDDDLGPIVEHLEKVMDLQVAEVD